jgi:hypothetical protein
MSKAHPAQMYDYLLGGKDHFEADREAIAALLKAVPNARTGARENRAFLGRAVKYLVAEAGIRQFLDIGAGLPTANNVHEVAQSIDPETRVVYVDNDPIVMAHAGRCSPATRRAGPPISRRTCMTRRPSSATRRCARRSISAGRSR